MNTNGRFRPFLERLRGLSFVGRWNFHPRLTKETVAEHSFYVAAYALLFAFMDDRPSALRYEILASSLLHDIEEAITGDLPMLVKRDVGPTWDGIEDKGLRQILGDLPNFVQSELMHHKQITGMTASDMDLVKRYVKAADVFDVIMYCRSEKRLGNTYFMDIEQEASTILRRMKMDSVDAVLDEFGYPRYEHSAVELPKDMTHL